MTKFLPFLSIAVIMTACNSNADTISAKYPEAAVQQALSVNADTTGFAAFQNQQAQNELVVAEEPKQTVQYADPAPVRTVRKTSAAPIRKASKSVASAPRPKANTNTNSSSGNGVSSDNGSGTMSSESTETAKAEEKKGWSKSAKGAVIGGVTGAAAGAILNKKNRAVGAVIGGVIGAGGGYVLGRGMDKKDGRIEITNK